MLKKFELLCIKESLLHNCQCKTRENNYWDNIYKENKKDKLHIYCNACPIKLPIFYTLGFKIKKGADDYRYVLVGKEIYRIYEKITTNIIEYEIEI